MLNIVNEAQLARLLNVAHPTLHKRIAEGVVKAVAEDSLGRLYFNRADLADIRAQFSDPQIRL